MARNKSDDVIASEPEVELFRSLAQADNRQARFSIGFGMSLGQPTVPLCSWKSNLCQTLPENFVQYEHTANSDTTLSPFKVLAGLLQSWGVAPAVASQVLPTLNHFCRTGKTLSLTKVTTPGL